MRRFRTLATLASLWIVVGISLAATLQVASRPLPPPDVTDRINDRRALLDYLSTTSVAAEPPVVQRKLIQRIEQELRDAGAIEEQVNAFNDTQWNQCEENLALLMRVWFMGKVDDYFLLPPERRERYLEREARHLTRWPVVMRTGQQNGARRGGIFRRLGRMIEELDEAQRQRAQQFLRAAQQQLAARMLGPF